MTGDRKSKELEKQTTGKESGRKRKRRGCFSCHPSPVAVTRNGKSRQYPGSFSEKAGGYGCSNLALTSDLCLNNARSDEENQFLVCGVHGAVLEQVAEERNVAEQRHLRHIE